MRVPLVAPVDLTGTAAASLALIAAIFAPGMAVVSLLRLGRDALERFVLSVAIGRLLFAAVTLIATGTIGRSLLIGWAVAGGATGIALLARRRRAPDAVGRSPGAAPWTLIVPVAVAITAALLLVHAVVARSGLVNAAGEGVFVKFHWKPKLGVHSLLWEECQQIAGKDPDFNRRDLWDAIEAGQFPEWELGVQLIPESDEFAFPFDLLDSTKLVPEERVPVIPVGRMGRAEEVAAAICFLAGPDAGFITGEVLDINGGMWAD